jgi:hypothetical protein
MSDCNGLRQRAAKLFALAISAREGGRVTYADHLTDMANESLAQAEEIERRPQQESQTDGPDKK